MSARKPVVLWLVWCVGESHPWATILTRQAARRWKGTADRIVRIEIPAASVPRKGRAKVVMRINKIEAIITDEKSEQS